ncbi:MAG: hypothetical protein ABIN44_09810 [Burkholderiaceae bacterium]
MGPPKARDDVRGVQLNGLLPSRLQHGLRAALVAGLASLLAACASGPPLPDWHGHAQAAMQASTKAYLLADTRVETLELERARREIARTGRLDLLARAELMHCAARVASLVFEPCAGFEALRADAAAPERAYADYLANKLATQDVALLPAAQRANALSVAGADNAASTANLAALKAIEEPLSRLVAAGVLFQASRADPAVIALATETASAQGWRRPLLAWLSVQLQLAERGGASAEAGRLRRRIGVVQGAAPPARGVER